MAGLAPTPVKRYRPGAPPASPHIGPRALADAPGTAPAGAPLGTPIPPWYRRGGVWAGVVAAILIVVLVVALATRSDDDQPSQRLGARPPAAAPAGTEVVDGAGVGIAVPDDWTVSDHTDDGAFDQLEQRSWGTPLVATSPDGKSALVAVRLRRLQHQPQVDPELFWSDQVADGSKPSAVTPFGVHGFRANRVTVAGDSESLQAAAVDTGDAVYLVAVRAPDAEAADTTYQRVIQTFDPR